jgi:TRAP-type mannitol/chloroaromatic compound transport system permease large subunit
LLQALALYALVGALLNRLALADSLFTGLRRLLGLAARGTATEMAILALGTLLAPMNGSVGASLLAVARSTSTSSAAAGLNPARRAALVSLAGTLGVIVPPSLVLLLLGDAMMRAHTEGLNLARQLALPLAHTDVRIVNTQDVLQAALLPGGLLLAGWLLITALRGRRQPAQPAVAWSARERWAVLLVPALVATLLALVASGRVRAVEAAALAGLLLLAWAVVSRQLSRALLWQVLDDAMALTGALFALLLAATSFSLLLRGLGTDRLVSDSMFALQGQPALAVAATLAVLLACAFVLDAFELIFLVIPIVMPPLLSQVADAAWVATLALLVLQLGFALPPFGYAIVLARGQFRPRPALDAMTRAVWPYLAWSVAVLALVALMPQTTRWLRSNSATLAPATAGEADVERLMREMSQPSK